MMVPGERKQQILALLERKRYVTVEELSTELFVSLPTVRRDLAALEQEGALTRTHGGASYNQAGTQVAPFILREKNNYEEKQIIGNIAAGLIENGDTLFISSSSTTLAMVRQLSPDLHMQVLTNGMTMAQVIGQYPNANVYIPAGHYTYEDDGIYGPDVVESVSKRFAKYGFICCDGVDMEHGLTVNRDTELFLERAFRKNCEKLVLLVDHTKFDTHFFYQSMELSEVDILVTDQDPGEKWEAYCRKQKIELLY